MKEHLKSSLEEWRAELVQKRTECEERFHKAQQEKEILILKHDIAEKALGSVSDAERVNFEERFINPILQELKEVEDKQNQYR